MFPHTNDARYPWKATDEVAHALTAGARAAGRLGEGQPDDGHPVVALESTVLTHGLPREPRSMSAKFMAAFPEWDPTIAANLAAAKCVESAVRSRGAVPATIALIDGCVCVGLAHNELAQLCANENAKKVSLRDMGSVIARSESGGTTVAATAAIAARAGISLFATGGIGGVHRGWSHSLDFSADLLAIATHRILVVSAGVKILLDLAATMEALESLGIPVIGYRTTSLPRFTVAPDPTLELSTHVRDASEAAGVVAAHWSVRPSSGALLMQPCPEAFVLPAQRTELALSHALAEATRQGVRGSATTPFLLARLADSGDGQEMLEANLALLFANAALAAEVASALRAP
ncbi:MAG: pseudouridine-5'-phosphate glycosidase [Phycisphaerales bacterium]|nr:pseudouridine-5'-phosphate glycosidase [Phycisphaerales bacterium]